MMALFWARPNSFSSSASSYSSLLPLFIMEGALDAIWRTYSYHKPTGNAEMFASDVGWPILVVALLWCRYGRRLSRYGVLIIDILVYLSFIAKYNSLISTAGEWKTYKGTIFDRIVLTRTALRRELHEVCYPCFPSTLCDLHLLVRH